MNATSQVRPHVVTAELHQLDRKLVHGIAWTSLAKWSSQLLTWLATMFVARLLTPADYALVAMSALFMGLITLLSEFGIGATIIAKNDLSRTQIAQLNSVSILAGTLCTVAGAAASLPISRFFSEPRLVWVVTAMSSAFLISSFQVVPYSLLQKDLRFKLLGAIEAVRALAAAIAAVVLAMTGFGYWSLVLPNLLSVFLGTGLVVWARPRGFAIPSDDCRKAVKLGNHILFASLAWYVVSNADFLVAGKLLGQAATGAYVLAWYIASAPVDKITAMVSRVGPAFFSAVQGERDVLRRYLFGLSNALAFITFPASLGLALIADDLVHVAFGPKWQAAIMPLRLLAFAASLRSITPLLNSVLNVVDDARYAMWNCVLCAVVMPICYVIGSRWGVAGIAVVWVAVFPITKWPMFKRVFQKLDTSGKAYVRLLWPIVGSCFFMSFAVMLFRVISPSTVRPGLRLASEVMIGLAAYAGAMLTAYREHAREAYRLTKLSFANAE